MINTYPKKFLSIPVTVHNRSRSKYKIAIMDTQNVYGLIIAGIAVTGGLAIGAISIAVSVPWSFKEKLAKLDAKNKERLALIEKGYKPEEVFREKKGPGQDPLFWGLLLAGIGLGIFVGYSLYLMTGWNRTVMTNSMAIFLGGVGLIAYHLYRKKSDDQPTA